MLTVYYEGGVNTNLIIKYNNSFQGETQGESWMYYKGTYLGLEEKYDFWE